MGQIKNDRIILISGGSVFLAPGYSLPLSSTSLDPMKMRFKAGKQFYWKTEIRSFDSSSGRVELGVIDYNPIDINSFSEQRTKIPINYIHFESLNWDLLVPQLVFYEYENLLHLLDDGGVDNSRLNVVPENPAIGRLNVSEKFQPKSILETDNEKKIIQENFKVYFTEAKFQSGSVKVIKYFKWMIDPVVVTIENSSLIPEFDLIKAYFPKAFGGQKKFEVNARFEVENGRITDVIAHSPQIARIDEELIGVVKRAQVMAYISRTAGGIDKSLFTADEFMSHYGENEEQGNALRQTEADILLASMADKSLRNRKQIEFLAGSQQSPNQKIRFTLKPNFGFVFFIEGSSMNHFCWELLNSHATYLWSFYQTSGTPLQQYKKVEQIIASVRESGRELYKSSYRTMPGDPDMLFSVISHGHAGSALVDSFPGWKHRLMEKLV